MVAPVFEDDRLKIVNGAPVVKLWMHVVGSIHNAAGTSAIRMDNPLERKLRDAHGCATHRWVAHSLYAELGRIFLGHEATPEFAGTGGPAPTSGR